MTKKLISAKPKKCYHAGLSWSLKEFEKYAGKIVATVAQDPYWAYKAGSRWSDERFFPYARILLQSLKKSKELTSQACNNWPQERIMFTSNDFFESAEISDYLLRACLKLGKSRKQFMEILKERLERKNIKELIFILDDSQSKKIHHDWVDKISPKAFSYATKTDLLLAHAAYQHAQQHQKESTFFEGLEQSLEDRTVREWSKTIVEYFRKETVGGHMYRVGSAA